MRKHSFWAFWVSRAGLQSENEPSLARMWAFWTRLPMPRFTAIKQTIAVTNSIR